MRSVLRLLASYASFLQRARGDEEAAGLLLLRATELAPGSGRVLGTYAHFLAREGRRPVEASELFGRALRCGGRDAGLVALWYAAFLRKSGRLAEVNAAFSVGCRHNSCVPQAEVMFISAIQNSGAPSVESAAICNYATFLFRQKKDSEQAKRLFVLGLRRFPRHKGLRRNYKCVLNSK